MSVPDTTTFNFFDVCDEIYGNHTSGKTLTQAFTDATGTFDANYVGSKNSLYNFRNYQHLVIPAITSIGFPNYSNDAAGEMTVETTVTGTITERGICFNTTGYPTIADSKAVQANTEGLISTLITGLTGGTYYYFTAYASNAAGIRYLRHPTAMWINDFM